MDTRLQNQAKASSSPSVSPVQTGLFQPRPFTDSEQEAAEASDLSHQPPNLQTQLEPVSRFGHNFSRVQVQTNTPSAIQTQLVNRQPEEQQDEEEANGVAEPLKMMAPPLGEPIEPESPEESIQMMPQLGWLTPAIQRQDQEEEPIQMMPQLGLLARVIQRQDQEEPIQTMPQVGLLAPVIQRQDQEDEPIQMMPQWGMLQRSPQEEDDLAMQMMPQWGVIQRQESEGQEEPIQMKWLQPKLVVGAPGDKYEQEADSVAAQVMSMSVPEANLGVVQRQGEEEQEQEALVQRSPLADSITPLVQRLPEEQEEAIQTKSLQQQGVKGNAEAGSDVESQLNQSKGGGSPLPDEVRSFMEPRFGTDFSSVRVHTDSTAVQMNKDLRAQAFAHGSDIYYGAGKSPAQDSLTAHELTHVVQQTGAKKLQQKPLVSRQSNKETLQAKISPAPGAAIQCKQAPDSPQADPVFQAVVNKTKSIASKEKTHPPAKAKSAEAQAAAKPPANEVESKAQDKKVQEMNQQKPGQFNAGAFKAALMQKIAAITPQTLEEADKFKENNKIDSVKGEVSSKVTEEKKQASGPVEEKTKEPPNTSGITPKPVTPLPPNPAGAKPGDVGAAGAAPKPKDASEVSLQEGCKSIDQQMASADVTEEQLKKSNEPEFQGALAAKNTAQADAAKAPQDYRQQEQATLTQAQAQAQATASMQLEGMHGSKEKVLAQVLGNQSEAKGQDEQKRAEVANRIQGLYNTTKQKVEAALSQLDKDVNTQFDQGAGAAKTLFENHVDQQMKLYKEQRYSGATGWAKWLKDKVMGMPSEVNVFYQKGKELYLASMEKTIDQISNLVSTKLNAAKTEIANSRQEIQKYVAGLDPSLRQVGQQAAQNIQGKFDELEQSVDNKQDELIDSLAQKYNDNLKQLDTRIDEMKAANRGLVDKAKDAIAGTIKTILELKNLLMGVLAKAAGAIDKIIKDPIGFLGNLISGIKQGFQNFAGNIQEHLKKGMVAFLTGALAGAGITMPENFDLKGIFSLVMQVLGVVYDGIKSRVIKALGKNGEKMFSALESSFEMFVILKNEGVAGLWQFIQDKIGDLKAMVIDTIQTFVVESVIKAGVMWVLSLLNPASAFVRACKAIYDIIMFFIERGSQIAELVSAVTESVAAIASGAVGGAAKLIENALGTALPVVISFMASLLGLGGISEKIEGVIKTVRQPIDKAIDWLIAQAVKFAKKIGNKLGFGKDKKGKEGKEDKSESEKKHAEMGNAAAQELAKKPSKEMSYEELHTSKEKQAKALENKYNKQLEKPVKMTITFKSPEEDKKDGDMDFHVHIGPNDFDTDGAVQEVGEQNAAERFKEELAKADPAAQPDILKALKQNAKEYDKLESWEAVKAKLSKDGRVKDFLEKPLLKEHKFGLQAHTNQAVPAVNRILGELGDAAPQGKTADDLVTNYKDQVHSSKAPFKNSRQHLANQVFDASQKSAASNALYTEFKEKLEKGDNDLDHTLYYPEHIDTKPNGKGTQITYVTRAGKSFRVNLDENQMVRAVKGFDLQLKGDAGIDNRGTTQDPDTKLKGKGQHSSHLIADQFMGSGYKKSLNLIAASSEFNLGPMSRAEDDIKAFIRRNKAITFDMQVTVTWGELDNNKVVGQIMQELQALPSDDKRSGLKNLEQAGIKAEILKNLQGAHKNLKRCMNVLYKVTVKTETGANIPMPEISTGSDLWLGL